MPKGRITDIRYTELKTFTKLYLYCHLAEEGVHTGNGVPAEHRSGEVCLKPLNVEHKMFSK